MKENWTVSGSVISNLLMANEIIVCNYESLNEISSYCWIGKSTKDFSVNAIGKWIIKYKTNEQ